jgi:RimJ/RimL family protein N-acetyltransferase
MAERIGWCQWYPYNAYPAEADAIGARAGDCGIDYAIGEPAAIGRGLGTEMIAALVKEVRRHHPSCGVIADPDARNLGSRQVLERNGFSLIAVRTVATEPTDDPVAIYRLGAGELTNR